MATTSVDGLVSGLDTTTLINQLMAAERAPVTRLETRAKAFDAVAGAWDAISGKLAALRTSLDAITGVNPLALFSATSSSASILGATAGSGASPGSLTVRVTALAAAHQLTSAGFASTASVVGQGTATIGAGLARLGVEVARASSELAAGAHTLTVTSVSGGDATVELDGVVTNLTGVTPGGQVTVNGTAGSLTLTVAAGGLATGTAKVSVARTAGASSTLADLASAISAAGGPASATALDTGTGTTPAQLVISATATGTAQALTVDLDGVTGFGAGLSTLRAAADASLTMGTLTITRGSNTITDLVPGVTLALHQADPATDVTVDVARDPAAITAKVKAVVDALSAVATTVGSYTTYDSTTKKAGALFGNSFADSVLGQLRTAERTAQTSGTATSLLDLGVTINRDGTYTLDETKLSAAIAANFDEVSTVIAGAATALKTTVANLTSPDGTIATGRGDATSQAKVLRARAEAQGSRLAAVELRYRKQFARLETLLGQLRDQSTALAGQLAGLPKYTS